MKDVKPVCPKITIQMTSDSFHRMLASEINVVQMTFMYKLYLEKEESSRFLMISLFIRHSIFHRLVYHGFAVTEL